MNDLGEKNNQYRESDYSANRQPKFLPQKCTDHSGIPPKLAYSVFEVAKTAGLSERFIRKQCYLGKLEHCRIGRRVLITNEQLQKFFANHSVLEK